VGFGTILASANAGIVLASANAVLLIGCNPHHCQHAHINVLASVIGIVHWNPPQQAMDAVVASAGDHSLNQYGSGAGLPDLVKALEHKLATENGITQVKTCSKH